MAILPLDQPTAIAETHEPTPQDWADYQEFLNSLDAFPDRYPDEPPALDNADLFEPSRADREWWARETDDRTGYTIVERREADLVGTSLPRYLAVVRHPGGWIDAKNFHGRISALAWCQRTLNPEVVPSELSDDANGQFGYTREGGEG